MFSLPSRFRCHGELQIQILNCDLTQDLLLSLKNSGYEKCHLRELWRNCICFKAVGCLASTVGSAVMVSSRSKLNYEFTQC